MKNKTWEDFLKQAGLSPETFKALNDKDRELLRAVFSSGKKLIVVRAGARAPAPRLNGKELYVNGACVNNFTILII